MNEVLVDAHCHLDLFESPTPTQLLHESDNNSILTIGVTNAPSVYFFTRDLAKGSRCVRAALGLHPELALERHRELPQFKELMGGTKYIGEVGLDFVTKDEKERQVQRQVFSTVLQWCADAGDKVLTVHSRRAAADVISMVGASFPGKVILHWFTGAKRDLGRAIDAGLYFSVNAAMVNSASGKALVEAMPRERVVTESDGPFATMSGVPCRPNSVRLALKSLAGIWGVSEGEAQASVARVFGEIVSAAKPPG